MLYISDCIPGSVVFNAATFHIRSYISYKEKFVCHSCVGGFMVLGIEWLKSCMDLVHFNFVSTNFAGNIANLFCSIWMYIHGLFAI